MWRLVSFFVVFCLILSIIAAGVLDIMARITPRGAFGDNKYVVKTTYGFPHWMRQSFSFLGDQRIPFLS
jgi:hypothetical protein